MEVDDPGPVNAALAMIGLSVGQLWTDYMSLGGEHTRPTIEEFLDHRAPLDRLNYNMLAQALNERFLDLGGGFPVPYAEDLPVGQ